MYTLPGLNKIKWVSLLLVAVFTLVAYTAQTREAPPPEQVKIGFIGDSITHGRVNDTNNAADAEVAALGSEYVAVNGSVNGSTTHDWTPGRPAYDDALADFKAQNVHVVSITLGTNDARKDTATPPEVYRKNLETTVKHLLRSGTVRQVIVNYPPYVVPDSAKAWDTHSPSRLESYIEQIDRLVRNKTVLQGDTEAFTYFRNNQHELMDGIHPDESGRARLGELWASAYRRLMLTSTVSSLQAHARTAIEYNSK